MTEINFHEQNKVLKDLAVLQLSLFRSRDLFDLGLYNGQGGMHKNKQTLMKKQIEEVCLHPINLKKAKLRRKIWVVVFL